VSFSCLDFWFGVLVFTLLLWSGLVISFVVGVKIVIRLRYPDAWLGWLYGWDGLRWGFNDLMLTSVGFCYMVMNLEHAFVNSKVLCACLHCSLFKTWSRSE